MSLKEWFASRRKTAPQQADTAALHEKEFKHLWVTCAQCSVELTMKAYEAALGVCPSCGYHHRVTARQRLAMLCDSFDAMDENLLPADPLTFSDTEPYLKRQADARKKAKVNEAVITGLAQIGQQRAALAVMDFSYMGGSMGSVVGEKITRLVEKAIDLRLPVIIVTASGGARMQEGIFSLMQMVKTGAALARLHEAGLLYLTLLTEPTFGGVTASFGTLGDIILAEEGARIGFAGRRVIEQTIRQKLPPDFQTAGYLLKYGQVDQVVKRSDIKARVETLLALHQVALTPEAQASQDSAFSGKLKAPAQAYAGAVTY
jgi:acetyl-CoA carboxylase carboxyl transferase subunit beta